MKPTAYLDAVKAQLNIDSDYALGKVLELPRNSIPAIRSGVRAVPLDVAYKIAITLDLDPARVVADLAEQRETNEKRRDFWRSFLSRVICIGALLIHTLAFLPSNISGSAPALFGGKNRRAKFA